MNGNALYTNSSFVVNANSSNADVIDTSGITAGLYYLQIFEGGLLIEVRLVNKN
ncbi:MAG: hypothetical protein V4613_14805 [Bacteroidota bacterium]